MSHDTINHSRLAELQAKVDRLEKENAELREKPIETLRGQEVLIAAIAARVATWMKIGCNELTARENAKIEVNLLMEEAGNGTLPWRVIRNRLSCSRA